MSEKKRYTAWILPPEAEEAKQLWFDAGTFDEAVEYAKEAAKDGTIFGVVEGFIHLPNAYFKSTSI